MIATAFDEDNDVLHPPNGISPDEVIPLSVFRGRNAHGIPVVISCWKFTEDELKEMLKTKRVWLIVAGETMSPVFVSGITPFEKVQNEVT
jgi:hypothetical protein